MGCYVGKVFGGWSLQILGFATWISMAVQHKNLYVCNTLNADEVDEVTTDKIIDEKKSMKADEISTEQFKIKREDRIKANKALWDLHEKNKYCLSLIKRSIAQQFASNVHGIEYAFEAIKAIDNF